MSARATARVCPNFMGRRSHISSDGSSRPVNFSIPPRKSSLRSSHRAPLCEDEELRGTPIRAKRAARNSQTNAKNSVRKGITGEGQLAWAMIC